MKKNQSVGKVGRVGRGKERKGEGEDGRGGKGREGKGREERKVGGGKGCLLSQGKRLSACILLGTGL